MFQKIWDKNSKINKPSNRGEGKKLFFCVEAGRNKILIKKVYFSVSEKRSDRTGLIFLFVLFLKGNFHEKV